MMGGGALTAQADDASTSTEPVPSLVVHHYYGVDTYPVALTDYNKVKIGEDGYTLQSPSGKPDITLGYQQYPRFSVQNVAAKDVVTSEDEVAADIAEAALTYCTATQTLKATASDAAFAVMVFNAAGQKILSGLVNANHELSVAALPAGIYVAVANDDTANYTLKFAKH